MNYRKEKIIIKHTKYLIFTLIFFLVSTALKSATDTTFINSLTKQAYSEARKNADKSIYNAHKALAESQNLRYKKGIADAQLALGAAFLAKYNPNDSATFYYHRALNDYTQQNTFKGMARVCYGLSYAYNFKGQTQKAIEYGKLSVEYFEKAGKPREVIAALEAVVFLEKQESNYEKALELSDKAIEYAHSLNDTLQWANALNNKGNVLKDMFLFHPAIDACFEAFKLWKLANDTNGLAIAYGSIANVYFFEGDYEKSLEYNFKTLPITKNAGNLWETNKTMNNIALSYSQLNKHDSALFYMRKSLIMIRKLNYPEGIASSFDNLASTFLSLGNTDSTLFYSSKAIAIAENINSPNLPKYLINKAMAYNHQKNYNDALALAKKSYNLAKQKNDNHTLKDASWLLNDIYYHLGQRNLAYPYLTEYLKLSDSITNMEYMRKVTRLDIQHEFEKKQKTAEFEIIKSRQQIEILNKTNELKSEKIRVQWLILLAVLLISAAWATISFLIIKNKNHRIGKMKLELQNYLLYEKQTKKPAPFHLNDEKCALTQRETEILKQISNGLTNTEIAKNLFVSENTVKFHIKNIYIKLDVKNRIQALHKAMV